MSNFNLSELNCRNTGQEELENPLTSEKYRPALHGDKIPHYSELSQTMSQVTPHNTVFIFSDEHNPKYSSVYGDKRTHTPNLEIMANQGVFYKHAYCPSPLCLPCRASFTSGKYVHDIQTYNNSTVNLRTDWPSWGQELTHQGIHVTFAGKLDTYNKAELMGFSEIIHPGDRSFPGDTALQRNPLIIRENARERARGYGPREEAYRNDIVVMDESIAWLKERSASIDRPWILAVNLLAPHFPHFTTNQLWKQYERYADLPEYGGDEPSANHERALNLRSHFETDLFSDADIKGLRQGYYACINWVDSQVGRILSTIGELNLGDTTNIVYASDHGEMLGKFGMWWKCSLYEDSVRVPLIACGPDFPHSDPVTTPVSLLDLQATLFDIAGAKRSDKWQGESLKTIENHNLERVVFSEYHGHGTERSSYMIRKGRWKLIYHVHAAPQLFDLELDPEELSNQCTKFPEIIANLENSLRKICDPEEEDRRAEAFIQKQLDYIESRDDLKTRTISYNPA